MKLHIELDHTHPSYAWLEQQADKIGAKGHYGTHIDCYTRTPDNDEFNLPVYILDCREQMPTMETAKALPSLENKALILYTGNLYTNDYGSKAYFDSMDTTVDNDILLEILKKKPQLILIDSYGIGQHGPEHQNRDKTCESFGCFVIENIRIAPEDIDTIHTIKVSFNLNYPSSGKPCMVIAKN